MNDNLRARAVHAIMRHEFIRAYRLSVRALIADIRCYDARRCLMLLNVTPSPHTIYHRVIPDDAYHEGHAIQYMAPQRRYVAAIAQCRFATFFRRYALMLLLRRAFTGAMRATLCQRHDTLVDICHCRLCRHAAIIAAALPILPRYALTLPPFDAVIAYAAATPRCCFCHTRCR